MDKIINPALSADEEECITSCGSVGFTWQQVADSVGLDKQVVKAQFAARRGNIYELYNSGRLQHELIIRQAVLKSAENGSSPSQQQMQDYYNEADSSIRELELES